MSELLKNAMIDAEALKKVAQSNAESLLLERFSAQIKEAVDQILEAPATDEGDDEDLTSNTPGGMDPIGMEGGDDDMGLGGTSGTGEPSMAANNVQMAAVDGEKMCPCADEDEEITIDFGDLQAQMAQGTDQGGENQLGSPMPSPSLDTSLSGEVAGDETDDEYSLKEDDLTALAEELSVDVTPVKSGWRDNSTLKTQDNVTAYLAHEQDDKVKEEREKMEKAIEELKESLKVSEEKKNKTLKENKEIKELLSKVKTLLENTNISNAKLLYTNKALTNSSLNERQKKNIAESLKKASSVENAKVIYEASLNSMQAGSIKTSPQSLNEAVSRPSTSSLVLNRGGNQNQNLKNTTSVSPQVERMQKLAGIRVGNNNTSGTK
jgi:hypothetical protein